MSIHIYKTTYEHNDNNNNHLAVRSVVKIVM